MFQICKKKFLLATCLFFAGCAIMAPIAPIVSLGIMWVNGEAAKYYATDIDIVHQATKNVLDEFKLKIIEEKAENNSVYIKAGDDDKFKITIVATRENVTKLLIRVNIMGDKAYAELLYRHIDEQPGIRQFVTVEELNSALTRQNRRKR